MDEQDKKEGMKEAMEECKCGMHHCYGGMHHHRFSLLRLLLALFIAAVVFWFGVKVGEFKSSFYGMGGHWGMSGGYMMYPGYDEQNGYGSGMMQYWNRLGGPKSPTTTPR